MMQRCIPYRARGAAGAPFTPTSQERLVCYHCSRETALIRFSSRVKWSIVPDGLGCGVSLFPAIEPVIRRPADRRDLGRVGDKITTEISSCPMMPEDRKYSPVSAVVDKRSWRYSSRDTPIPEEENIDEGNQLLT